MQRLSKQTPVEGLTVHEGCKGGNEEEMDCHSRIREEQSQSPRLWSNYVMTRGLDRGETQTHIYLTWKRWFVPSHSHLSVCVVL